MTIVQKYSVANVVLNVAVILLLAACIIGVVWMGMDVWFPDAPIPACDDALIDQAVESGVEYVCYR